jgi:hypothetical protein
VLPAHIGPAALGVLAIDLIARIYRGLALHPSAAVVGFEASINGLLW